MDVGSMLQSEHQFCFQWYETISYVCKQFEVTGVPCGRGWWRRWCWWCTQLEIEVSCWTIIPCCLPVKKIDCTNLPKMFLAKKKSFFQVSNGLNYKISNKKSYEVHVVVCSSSSCWCTKHKLGGDWENYHTEKTTKLRLWHKSFTSTVECQLSKHIT